MDGDSPQPSTPPGGNWQYKPADTPNNIGPSAQPIDPHGQTPSDPLAIPQPHPDEYAPQPANHPFSVSHDDAVSWSASEFIAHQKSAGWYAILFLVIVVTALAVFYLTRDKISTGAILFVGAIFGILAARKPRTLGYRVDSAGLTIGERSFDYDQFRSFAVVDEDAFSSIVFMPLRRFMPLITIYYDPKDEQKIVTILANRLPLETHQLDAIDQLMRRIRF